MALFTRVRYRTVPTQKVVRRGVAFTRVRKKSSFPFQNRPRNWAVRKSEPEIGTIRYRTVPFSCEQKNRSSLGSLAGPVWFPRVTPTLVSMTQRWFLQQDPYLRYLYLRYLHLRYLISKIFISQIFRSQIFISKIFISRILYLGYHIYEINILDMARYVCRFVD